MPGPGVERHDGDLVVFSEPVELPEGWLERMRDAARSDSIVGCVSALARTGEAPRLLPRTTRRRLTAGPGPVLFVRREAVELVGELPAEAMVRELMRHGLQHVLADDVLVGARDDFGEALVLDRISVTVDARCLRSPLAGTQVHALELIGALRRFAGVDLRVLLPPDPQPYAARPLEGLATVFSHELTDRTPRTAIVHRPYQVTSEEDLTVLGLVGERVVITHQDLIAYRNPAYHPDAEAWEVHRRMTRESMGLADAVIFESAHAAADARADGLISAERQHVVPIGIDHETVGAADPTPVDVPQPFLLALGTDYAHKNLRWAQRLVQAMRGRGWDGSLVVAGGEAEWGGERPDGAVRLAHVSEGEKNWLYAAAAAVVYPSTYEGFGLIPFEAARHGTPCLWAPVASLADWLPAEHAALVPWDLDASAERALAVLADPAPLVAAVRAAGEQLSWERAAQAIEAVYEQVVVSGRRTAVRVAADALAAEMERGKWHGMYWHLHNEIGPAGLELVGPGEPLLDESERRTVAALAKRGAFRRLLALLSRPR